MSEPRPIDCSDPDQEIEPLYEAVVAPYLAPREQRARVAGEIRRCLDELAGKFKRKQGFTGYKQRKVRVLRAYDGPSSTVVIEGVNLASAQAEQPSDAVVNRLLRLKAGWNKRLDVLVGYLSSPEGPGGEHVLVDWIEEQPRSKAFDSLSPARSIPAGGGKRSVDDPAPGAHHDGHPPHVPAPRTFKSDGGAFEGASIAWRARL